jgi:uncharacterized protein (TIGR02117 family)
MNRLLIACALLAGCAPMVQDMTLPTPANAEIAVIERGWHTDIALPTDELAPPLASLERDYPGARYLVFGFGEREYLMAHGGSGEMVAALFPSASAVLMTVLRAPPAEAFGADNAVTLRLNQAGVDRIAALIWQELEQQNGKAQQLADGPYPGSVFYASNETYDAFHTCNTWTAALLRAGGLPVESHRVLFANQVMRQVRRIAALQATGHAALALP